MPQKRATYKIPGNLCITTVIGSNRIEGKTMNPRARQENLVVQEVGDETIIYDEQRNHAHRLNRTAGLVWSHCNGQRTIADLVSLLQRETDALVTEDMIWLALDRLETEHLLQEKLVRPEDAARITRRDVLRKAALVGGMTLLIPMVQSMVAPTPAMAMSIGCTGRGQTYSQTRPCCPGLIQRLGRCVSIAGQP
jgi:hypothetical protein